MDEKTIWHPKRSTIAYWGLYSVRSKKFWSGGYPTQGAARKEIIRSTAGKRSTSASIVRITIRAVPVLKDGTSPQAKAHQVDWDAKG